MKDYKRAVGVSSQPFFVSGGLVGGVHSVVGEAMA